MGLDEKNLQVIAKLLDKNCDGRLQSEELLSSIDSTVERWLLKGAASGVGDRTYFDDVFGLTPDALANQLRDLGVVLAEKFPGGVDLPNSEQLTNAVSRAKFQAATLSEKMDKHPDLTRIEAKISLSMDEILSRAQYGVASIALRLESSGLPFIGRCDSSVARGK